MFVAIRQLARVFLLRSKIAFQIAQGTLLALFMKELFCFFVYMGLFRDRELAIGQTLFISVEMLILDIETSLLLTYKLKNRKVFCWVNSEVSHHKQTRGIYFFTFRLKKIAIR